jgi:RHS repeat-associated protein
MDGEAARFDPGAADVTVFGGAAPLLHAGRVVRDEMSSRELVRSGSTLIVTEWQALDQCVRRYIFADFGGVLRLSTMEVVGVNKVDVSWDTSGRLSTLRDHLRRRTLLIDSDLQSRIHAVALHVPGGTSQMLTRYEYDGIGRLMAAYNALGNADRYNYDSAGRIIREAARDGGVFMFRYDEAGRCVWTSGQGGFDEKYLDFKPHIGWTFVTDSVGEVWRYQWAASGQVTTIIDPLGGISRTEYDHFGRIVSRTDPVGATERFAYDDAGNRSVVTDPTGAVLKFRFNEHHLPIELTDKNGNRTVREYDPEGRVTAVTNPDGGRWEVAYTPDGRVAYTKDALQATEHYEYLDLNTTRVTRRNGSYETVFTDTFGNITRYVDPAGHARLHSYDALGRVIKIVYPDGTSRQYAYDLGGNLTKFIDGNGNTHTYRYGPCGRIIEQIDPVDNRLTFTWDTEPERLISVTNQRGENYRYIYDSCGRIIEEIGFDGRSVKFRYNSAGNCIAFTNGNGEMIEFELDLVGRILRSTSADSDVTYTYDANGHVLSAANNLSAVQYQYNSFGEVSQETRGAHSVISEYNPVGRRTRATTSAGGDIRFEYDAEEKLTRVHAGNVTWSIKRDGRSGEVELRMPGGVQLEQERDGTDRLILQRVKKRSGGTILRERHMKYDQTYNIVQLYDSRWGRLAISYDRANRPLRANDDRGWIEEFSYTDESRIARCIRGSSARNFTYGAGGRLLSDGEYRYEYDRHGRLTAKIGKKVTWRFKWNTADQLVRVSAGDVICDYEYDAIGRRIRKIVPQQTIEYFWDGSVPVHEFGSEEELVTWLFDPASFRPLARVTPRGIVSYICDDLGKPQEAVNAAGEIVWEASYTVWGELRDHAGDVSLCPVRFAGQWFDAETRLHYNWYRYYDPASASYVTQDPIRLLGGTSLYAYSINPMRWVDPFGLNTPPSLPPRDVVPPQNGVSVQHNYGDMSREHANPIHFHVQHPGGETKVRADGTVLSGQPLSKQAKELLGQKSTISAMRRAEKRLARYIRATGAKPGGQTFQPGKRGNPKKPGGCGK